MFNFLHKYCVNIFIPIILAIPMQKIVLMWRLVFLKSQHNDLPYICTILKNR